MLWKNRVAGAHAKLLDISFSWFVPHYAADVEQQVQLPEHFISKTSKEFSYIWRLVFMKDIKIQSHSTFEIGVRSEIDIPNSILVASPQRDRYNSQELNMDSFCGQVVRSSQCIIRMKRFFDLGSNMKCDDDDDWSQDHDPSLEWFQQLTKNAKLEGEIPDHGFRSSFLVGANAATKNIADHFDNFDT